MIPFRLIFPERLRRPFRRLRIRLLLLLFLAALPALGVTAYAAHRERQEAAREASAELLRLARMVQAQHQRLIEGSRQLLAALSRLPEIRERNPEAASRLLAGLLEDSPLHANLGVADPDGGLWGSGLPFSAPLSVADKPWFRKTMQTGSFAVGDCQAGNITGKSTLHVGTPVVGQDERLVGVAFAALDLDWLSRLGGAARLPEGRTMILADAEGRILARHPDPEAWAGRGLEIPGLADAKGEGTVAAPGFDGDPWLWAFLPLQPGEAGSPLALAGVPESEAYAAADRAMAHALLAQGIALGLLVAAMWILGDKVLLRRLVVERTREYNLLNELAELLQSCQTPEEAYGVIARLARRLFPKDRGALYLLDPGSNQLKAATVWGDAAPEEIQAFAPDACWALRRGRLHEVRPLAHEQACQHVGSGRASSTYACIPMVAHGETIGILHLQGGPSGLLAANRRTAKSVAHQCALALANLRLRDTLRHQSIRDVLTGLYNRRYAEAMLARELEAASRGQRRLGLMMIDIDHFKRINDTFGHDAGDALLRDLGALLKQGVREMDIPCRYGGEEFLVILPEASLEETRRRAEDLRGRVKAFPFMNHDRSLGQATVSVGVAGYPGHAQTAEGLLKAADGALYRAKDAGRDRVEAPVLPVPWEPPAGRPYPEQGAERLRSAERDRDKE